ncbi:MAG TPA: NAD-dependent epimerase/dehydratase family protein [Bacteroidales bacterium]|nr:NAD-dependent epimerase/dehydratase family protein [Bacteroidales bacterium]
MQTILGAGGAIGSLLAGELKDYTDMIRLVSRHPVRINETDELFQADILNPEMTDKAIEGSEVVYLVAGLEYKIRVWEENWPKIVRSVTDSCMKYKSRLVFFDNVYMYDIDEIPHMTEDSLMNPPSRKGAVRKQLVDIIMNEVKAGRLMALIARSADFYGPGNSNSIMTELVYNNLKKGRAANWFVDADRKHSFTFTPDAAKATALLGNTPDAFNQVWHLPTDRNTLTGREFVRLFADGLNVKNRLMVLPVWMLKLMGFFVPVLKEMPEMMYQYDRDYYFDSSKFETRFDLKPTSYIDGIKQIING